LFTILAASGLAFNQKCVFAILATSDLAFNQEKCVFAISELDFMVRHISATGVAPSGPTLGKHNTYKYVSGTLIYGRNI
jgi:hypothetical protein